MGTSYFRSEVEIWPFCMRNASGHNYWNRLFIMGVAVRQIPRFTEGISSCWKNSVRKH